MVIPSVRFTKNEDTNRKICESCKSEIRKETAIEIFKKINEFINDYFNLNWGEFKSKYPDIKHGALPGSEIKELVKDYFKQEYGI